MTRLMTPCLVLTLICAAEVGSRAQAPATVFINEIHYDNTGTDAGEFIESYFALTEIRPATIRDYLAEVIQLDTYVEIQAVPS